MYLIYDKITNYSIDQYKSFYYKLDDIYKDKINHLIYDNDKQLSILAQILLSKLLIDKYFIDYKDINFKFNKYNKPFIDNINFNISHSYEYSVVVTSNNKIGVDIEYIREVDISIINYFCTDCEIKYIMNSSNKYRSLFEIFCLKEAYFKMIGTGIGNIKDVEFIIQNDIIKCNKSNLNIMLDYSINNYIIAIIEEI